LKIQNEPGDNSVVVTVFPDDNKKYLSTDLLKNETVKDDFLSKDVKLPGFGAYKRVCHTCCDPLTCIEGTYEGPEEIQLPICPKRVR
jgi:cysteine synthase